MKDRSCSSCNIYQSVAEFVDPWRGDKVNSGIGMSYGQLAHVAWRAGTTTLCRSWPYLPSQDLWIRLLVLRKGIFNTGNRNRWVGTGVQRHQKGFVNFSYSYSIIHTIFTKLFLQMNVLFLLSQQHDHRKPFLFLQIAAKLAFCSKVTLTFCFCRSYSGIRPVSIWFTLFANN